MINDSLVELSVIIAFCLESCNKIICDEIECPLAHDDVFALILSHQNDYDSSV